MTQAKAASVAAALVTAGYYPRVAALADGSWLVYVTASTPTAINAVKSFQDAQGISGTVSETIFS